MAKVDKAFKTKGKERMKNFPVLPANLYILTVTKSDIKKTNDKKGKYISLTFQVMKGDFKGRLIFANYNIQNRSVEAVKIAEAELCSLCDALGINGFKDTKQLHDIKFIGRVGIRKQKGYDDQNVIKEYINLKDKNKTGNGKGKKKGKSKMPWE